MARWLLVSPRGMAWLGLGLACLAGACLAVCIPAYAAAENCPRAVAACPFGGVVVVGEGGHGVFRFPQALAMSPDGRRVYVGDSMSFRVQAFTRDGLFVGQWGRYGAGPGEIKRVGGLATDAAGHVFVLDSNNDRVQVFDPDGGLIGTWGASGSEPGQFDLGINGGLAVDGDMVYVADEDNHRIQRFALDPATGMADTTPGHVLTWGSFGDCASSCTSLNFNHPQGVAVSTVAGHPHDVFVADDDNHRVLKFDAAGSPLGAIDAPGELGYPYDVAVDSTHALYVVDNCDPSFTPVCTYTTGERSELTHQRVRKYDAASLALLGSWGVFGDQPGQFEFPRAAAAVTADPAGGVYVADAANNRVQSFDAGGRFQGKWGISGRGPGYLTGPAAVASDANGNIYVADTSSDRIQEFGVDGRYRGEWGRLGTTGYPAASTRVGGFRDPAGVAVGADGTIYVADTGNNRLQARDPLSGTWRVLPGPTLRGPRGVAVDGSGRLYVADTGADLVRALDPATGQWSTLDRDFSAPRAVAVGASGDVYVADTGADRVQVRDARTGSWTVIGADELRRPSGLAAQGTGIVVADTGHDRLMRLGPHGNPTDVWGARGVSPAEFDGPQGVAVDATGRVLVADQFNNRVQIFDPGPASEQTQAPAPPARPEVAPGPAPAPGASGRPEPLTVTVSRLHGVRTLRRTGLRLELACSHACMVSARLMTTARAARRLGLSRSGRPLTVAARRVLLADAQPRRIHLRLRPRAARAAGRLPLALVVSAVDTAGARTRLQRRL